MDDTLERLVRFTQYLAPTIAFLFGAFVMLEPMPTERWIGFAFVSTSLVLASIDLLHASRGRRRSVVLVAPKKIRR